MKKSDLTIAIQPDYYGPKNASSPLYFEILGEAGFQTREIDLYADDVLDHLRDCHGLVWRCAHYPDMLQVARRIFPLAETQLGLELFPDYRTFWHYDDKIAQKYLLDAIDAPVPETHVFFRREDAESWMKTAKFPQVLKLSGGAGSINVVKVESAVEAEPYLEALFCRGVFNLDLTPPPPWPVGMQRLRSAARLVLSGRPPNPPPAPKQYWEMQRNYVLFQEFCPGNEFDTRVTVVGDWAFSYRRMNRPDDFRASGSGNSDWNPEPIDRDAFRLAFQLARRLKVQSVAFDFLYLNGSLIVNEISYTYVSWMVHDCHGHYEISPDDKDGSGPMTWVEGNCWPEVAHMKVYQEQLQNRYGFE